MLLPSRIVYIDVHLAIMSIPDLVVPFEPRSLLSLAGIVTLVLGVWYTDRKWDEDGSKAYERAAKEAKNKEKVVIPEKELEAAFAFPTAFLVGWVMYAVGNLFQVQGGFDFDLNRGTILAAIASLMLAWIASVPMENAVRTRNAALKQKLSMSFVGGWILLTTGSIMSSANSYAAVLNPAGMVCIIASMKILWKFRKMGDSWEQEGKPNPNPVVYNMGGPLFVFGWFLYWVGMAATPGTEEWDGSGLPIYFNLRLATAMAAGCGMVPVVMFLDYAHDEGANYTGWGTDGRFFGRFLESPVPFLAAWALFGLSCHLNMESEAGTRQYIIVANCILQGIDAGVLIQTALYKGDMAAKTRWSIPFVLLFLALAINIGMTSNLALGLALPGAALIIAGQKTVFGDRKRGDYFMTHDMKTNPNPIVYSYGELLFMLGWIMISLAMALPM